MLVLKVGLQAMYLCVLLLIKINILSPKNMVG